LQRLLRAHAEDNAGYVEEVIRTLATLRDAWEHAERAVRSGQAEPQPAAMAAGMAAR
jgi:flagellin-specific chaperone FliS